MITGTTEDIAGDWATPITALPTAGTTRIANIRIVIIVGMIRTIVEIVAMMARQAASRGGTRSTAIDPKTVATDKDRTRTIGTTRFRPSRANQVRTLHAKTIVSNHAFVAMTAALEGQMSQRQTGVITGLRQRLYAVVTQLAAPAATRGRNVRVEQT